MEKTLRILEMTWRGRRVMLNDGKPKSEDCPENTGLGHIVRGILYGLSWHIPDDYYSANRSVPFIRADVVPFDETEITEIFVDDISAGNIILTADKHFVVDFDPLTLSITDLEQKQGI